MAASDPKHPVYDKRRPRWAKAWDVYTGAYAFEGKIGDYLIQRAQGEASQAYEERKKTADPALDMGRAIDALVGLLFQNEAETTRTWRQQTGEGEDGPQYSARGLGDPQEEGTEAHRLRTNVDGDETSLVSLLWKTAARLTVLHEAWGVVDGAVMDGETVTRPPVMRGINPHAVVSPEEEAGRLVEVLVKGQRVESGSVLEDKDMETVYTRYHLNGWEKLDEDLNPTGEEGEYTYYATADQKRRILPIFRHRLPLPREVGYLLALKQLSIFNGESELDNLLRMGCTPRFGVAGDFTDFEQVREDVSKGEAIIEKPADGNDHGWYTPPMEAAEIRAGRLEQKRLDFYHQAFQSYGDAAKEKTATEIGFEVMGGVGAFVELLAEPVTDFERAGMWRMEQALYPQSPALGHLRRGARARREARRREGSAGGAEEIGSRKYVDASGRAEGRRRDHEAHPRRVRRQLRSRPDRGRGRRPGRRREPTAGRIQHDRTVTLEEHQHDGCREQARPHAPPRRR